MQLVHAVAQFIDTVLCVFKRVRDRLRAVPNILSALHQLIGAVVQIPRAVLHLRDFFIQIFGVFNVLTGDGHVHVDAVDRDGVHLKVGNVGGDGVVLFRFGQDQVGKLSVAAHVRRRRALRCDVGAALRVERHRRLQGEVLEKRAAAVWVLPHGHRDRERAALSGQFLRRALPAVEKIAESERPRQGVLRQRSLIVEPARVGVDADGLVFKFDLVVGRHIPQRGIIAVVDDLAGLVQLKNVDHVNALHAAVRVQIDVDHLLLRHAALRGGESWSRGR